LADLDESNAATKDQLAVSLEKIANLEDSAKQSEVHIQNLTVELEKKSCELEQAVAELATARTSAAEAASRIKELELGISDLQKKHQEQLELLNSRIETEAAHRVESFKHSLARVLRVDYTDFKINEAKPMTTELGQGLHHLLGSIFDHLQRNGINTKD
jgi:chromosome segregation ATPase